MVEQVLAATMLRTPLDTGQKGLARLWFTVEPVSKHFIRQSAQWLYHAPRARDLGRVSSRNSGSGDGIVYRVQQRRTLKPHTTGTHVPAMCAGACLMVGHAKRRGIGERVRLSNMPGTLRPITTVAAVAYLLASSASTETDDSQRWAFG